MLRAQRGYPGLVGTRSACILGAGGLVTCEISHFDEAETVRQAFGGGTAALGEERVQIAWFVGAWTAVGEVACVCIR